MAGKKGFADMLISVFSSITQVLAASIFPSVTEGIDQAMAKIETRIMKMEKKILKDFTALFLAGFGAVFLVNALLYYLIESLKWDIAAAHFTIGITIFVAGLLLMAFRPERE